jgi:hypothetical protein
MPRWDAAWKEVLQRLFPPAIELFLPELHAEIDWTRGVEFLETELRQAIRGARPPRGVVDLLARVWRPDGAEAWLLIHIEVQRSPELGFPLRMFDYHERIRLRFGRHPRSVAVLIDAQPDWRPTRYDHEDRESGVSFRFTAVKLLDYRARSAELEASDNPFALIVLAHLEAQAGRDPPGRLAVMLRTMRLAYRRGWPAERVVALWQFLHLVMELPPALEQAFEDAIDELEEESQMPRLLYRDRRAIQRGRLENAREYILEALEARFGEPPPAIGAALAPIEDAELLRTLHKRAATVASLSEFQAVLATLT